MQEGDAQRRLDFCYWLQNQIGNDNNFLRSIIWSDEAKFSNCGIFNRNNERIWAVENPRYNREIRRQVRFSINVWAGMFGDKILGPIFLPDRLKGADYLFLLNTHLQDFLAEIPLARLPAVWFQQDGAPVHGTREVREFLDNEFPGRWIGNRGVVEWPARSPDLTPLDFFLWGALKNKIYKHEVNTLEELRARIIDGFRSIRRRSVQRSTEKVRNKIDRCIRANGNLFEHLK